MGRHLHPSIARSPCDGCGLRKRCAAGFDCRAYRRYLDGTPLSAVLQWRGHRLQPVKQQTAGDER